MKAFPRMIDQGRTVQAGPARYVNTPTALDGETRWKLCAPDEPGAVSLIIDELHVDIDRDASIAANRESLAAARDGLLGQVADALDIARHAAMRLLGR